MELQNLGPHESKASKDLNAGVAGRFVREQIETHLNRTPPRRPLPAIDWGYVRGVRGNPLTGGKVPSVATLFSKQMLSGSSTWEP